MATLTNCIEASNYHHLVMYIAWFGISFATTSRFLQFFALRRSNPDRVGVDDFVTVVGVGLCYVAFGMVTQPLPNIDAGDLVSCCCAAAHVLAADVRAVLP